ncbi:hypothetical protein EDB19DRAFT_1831721 [Suillus lakei]|nr:hypothetical protein EDB19DRAFT_1831721 [Suillus lakei]
MDTGILNWNPHESCTAKPPTDESLNIQPDLEGQSTDLQNHNVKYVICATSNPVQQPPQAEERLDGDDNGMGIEHRDLSKKPVHYESPVSPPESEDEDEEHIQEPCWSPAQLFRGLQDDEYRPLPYPPPEVQSPSHDTPQPTLPEQTVNEVASCAMAHPVVWTYCGPITCSVLEQCLNTGLDEHGHIPLFQVQCGHKLHINMLHIVAGHIKKSCSDYCMLLDNPPDGWVADDMPDEEVINAIQNGRHQAECLELLRKLTVPSWLEINLYLS